jgi:hypothetical protein
LVRPFSLSAHSPHRAVPSGEKLVAASAQQQGLGSQGLFELELGPLLAVLVPDPGKPATALEALLAGRVLHDSVQRDVLANHDLSHLGSFVEVVGYH